MSRSRSNVVKLPNDFIGKEDEAKLESFGGHLISHGSATRWHWQTAGGVDVQFLIYTGAGGVDLLALIGRDSARDKFYAADASGKRLAEGSLEAVMTAVDGMARARTPEPPA